MNNFIHLHCHNEYSLLDGFGTSSNYAKKIIENNQLGMALTNHANVDGNIKFQNEFIKNNLIPIHGVEFYIVNNISEHPKGEKRSHLLALVKNEIGWTNILQMLTIANLDGQYYRPRISPEILLEHCEGLIISTACSSSFIKEKWGRKLLKDLYNKIGNDLYTEVMPFNMQDQIEVNELSIKYANALGLKTIATNDCHYINKDDAQAQEVLLAIQTKKRWNDSDRWKFQVDGLYAKNYDEMFLAFKKQKQFNNKQIEEYLDNTLEVFEKCKDFRIPERKVALPKTPELKEYNGTAEELLWEKCLVGFEKITENKSVYKKRLNDEMKLIVSQGFCEYFLIVEEVIRWCKENNIMTGPGRGSAGGSLVCYLLDITKIDPIRFDLLFSRFISPDRIDLPDIDNDFQDNKRQLVIEHFKEIYGENHVACVSTFMSMKGKGALRDVSRVFDIPLNEVNEASKNIDEGEDEDSESESIIGQLNNTSDGKLFIKKYPTVYKMASKLENQIRGKGMHAAAVVISKDNLRNGDKVYLQKTPNKNKNDIVVNWDKYDIEYEGLMKLDILGINALTVLNEARELIKINTGEDIVYEDIDLNDPKIFKEFSKGNNDGVFQFGTYGLKKLCKEMGIETFMHLSDANALCRPGTAHSGLTDLYIQRKHGQKIPKQDSIIEKITKNTFGIILYQEQLMQIVNEVAGLDWKIADKVRKVVAKSKGSEEFLKFKKTFASGCVKNNTLSKIEAEKLWDELAAFGSYSFNKSHSVAYSVISYWDMFIKLYYPTEFICASLTCGSKTGKQSLIEDALKKDIDIRPPKIGKSDSHKWIVKNDVMYCPFIEVKGFGDGSAKEAMNKKNKVSTNQGFFDLGENIGNGKKTKVEQILSDIDAYKDVTITSSQDNKIKDYFDFRFKLVERSRYD
jgi:DNA polymerase-3 subunit alpha